MFTSGERQKLALRSKAGSYFSVSFPQVAPYKTETQTWVRKQNQAVGPKGSKCPGSPLRATAERPLRQETKGLTAAPEGGQQLLQVLHTSQDSWMQGERGRKG